MTFDPVAATRRYHDALDILDLDAVERCFAAGAVYVSSGVGGRIEGRTAILSAFRAYFDSYPDQSAQDEAIEALSPYAARAQWRLSATHAVTGVPTERRGVETIHFDATGRIARIDVRDGPLVAA